MLPIQPALYEILSDDSGIAAIALGGVFPLKVPQALRTYPVLVFGRPTGESRERIKHLESRGYSGLTISVFHIVSIVQGYGMEAYTLSARLDAAVFQALQGYSGTVSQGSPAEEVWIDSIQSTNWMSEGYDEDRKETFITSEFAVAHSEPIPPVVV